MENSNLDKIFKPDSIAVIGGSEKAGSIGFALIRNLQAGAYQGKLFPVNPNYRTIDGVKTFVSVAEIGEPDRGGRFYRRSGPGCIRQRHGRCQGL